MHQTIDPKYILLYQLLYDVNWDIHNWLSSLLHEIYLDVSIAKIVTDLISSIENRNEVPRNT